MRKKRSHWHASSRAMIKRFRSRNVRNELRGEPAHQQSRLLSRLVITASAGVNERVERGEISRPLRKNHANPDQEKMPGPDG